MHLVCAFSGCSTLVSALVWVLLSCIHSSSHTLFSLSAYVHSHCVPSVPAHVCFPPCWQSIWRPVEPPYLACASIQVAWLHSGSVATLRPAATASPIDAPALALLHTLDLHTPCRCSYCCALLCCSHVIIFHSFALFVCVLFLSFLICIILMGTGDVHSSHSDLGGLDLSTRTSTSTLPGFGVVQAVFGVCYMGRSMFGVQGGPLADCM